MSDIRYARSGDQYVAYRVEGDGPVLLVCDEASMVSIDSVPDEPHWHHFNRRLASFSRLVTFDRSGIGLSDRPPPGSLDLRRWAQDALAVLDAVGADRAAVFGACGAGIPLSLWETAPERISHLALFNAHAKFVPDDTQPWMLEYESWLDAMTSSDRPDDALDDVALLLPSLAGDATFRRWWTQAGQRGASPKMAAEQNQALITMDLRHVLPTVTVPTLVLSRLDVGFHTHGASRQLADGIPGARIVDLPGRDWFPFAGDADAVADEIEEFLTGSRATRPVDRVLTTVLFSDIVGSTEQASRLGDHEWRGLLDLHDAAVRRQFQRFGGHEVNTTGDGFLATFDTPARAIQCGLAVGEAAREVGVEVRVGIHSGEVERRGNDIGGIAVHLGARILGAAEPGSVFVSSTVKDLVTGSGLQFRDCGARELKGFDGAWQLFAVVP